MTVITDLSPEQFSNQLVCPPGKTRIEIVDPQRTGLYIEVRAPSPGRGTYYVRFKNAAKKSTHQMIGRTTEMSLEDARAAAVRIKAAARATQVARASVMTAPATRAAALQNNPDAPYGAITLDAFMADYYFPHVQVHKRSWKRDVLTYKRIKPLFGHLPLRSITRLAVTQFQSALAAEGLAPATVNHHPVLLRHVLNMAMSWEMLEKNVLARIPLLRLDNQVEHYLDDEQVDRLVGVLKADKNRMVSLILMFLLATGARLNEGTRAKWADIDVDNKVWRIPASNSKSKKQKHVPLNSAALWVIEQLETEGASKFLFPSPRSDKPFTTITRQWYRIRRKAGIPGNVRIHDLRHTFASRMVSAGRSLFEVQHILGHADSRTTQRYAHLSMKAAQEASNAAAFSVR